MKNPIKVLGVDDSALMRRLMSVIVDDQPDMVMVATAADPLIARELIKRHSPDVLTLDVEMPRMDGLDFLEKLMRLRPMPVVMVSSLTARGSETTLAALALGAVDFIAKPRLGAGQSILDQGGEIAAKIRIAASARPRPTVVPRAARVLAVPRAAGEKLIVVGASTGGTEALCELLVPMPPDAPATLITQHMPAGFTASFARRLDRLCKIRVSQAEHGQRVRPGHAYLAPGGERHLKLARGGGGYRIVLEAAPPVNRHRPSVDVLFDSAAACAGANAIGVLLTGMGKDGARGLLRLRAAGAPTLAQSEASCVVFGMPREAIAIGAAERVVAIDSMGETALAMLAADRRPSCV